jgi:uncharacterized protein with NRDE domain
MCLIALAWRAHPQKLLVVAANRDEWRERPAEPAHWWPDHPDLLAGRDLQAGGTWMGITRGGRFAAVTNFRDPSDKRSTARSRGSLVADFLLSAESAPAFLARLAPRAGEFNGFNLILGDGDALFYFGSREGEARAVEPGVHALSNHLLDEPWPKVRRASAVLREALAAADLAAPLFAMLSDASAAEDGRLPDTGVGLEWERRLSPALITGRDYGTRASTLLVVGSDGRVHFEERTRDDEGGVTGARRFAFAIGADGLKAPSPHG